MDNYGNQIAQMLGIIKKTYAERNKSNIELLSQTLFSCANEPIIIGTGNSEWCFGLSECENIFISDWQSWGNVSIDTQSLRISNSENMGSFIVKGGVEYIFNDNDEKYKSYMELVNKIIDSQKTPIAKSAEIIWFLSHLLHSRNSEKRKYIWDLNISGITQLIEGIPKIKIMQFSVPITAAFPDIRLDSDEEESAIFKMQKEKISNLGRENNLSNQLSCISKLNLSDESESLFVGFDGIHRNADDFRQYLKTMESKNGEFIVNPSEIISFTNVNSFGFCGVGIFKRKVSADDELNKIFKNIDEYSSGKNTKHNLFRIRRDLSLVLKESLYANEHNAPFRFEGMGYMDNKNQPIIKYMQLSYPFNWILEQKTDMAENLEF